LGNVVRPLLRIQSPYLPALMTGFEAGMMGYAIYTAVYGADNVYKFAIVDLGQVTFVFFILVPMLERLATGGKPFRDTVLNFFKTPVILAILGGLILGQTGLYNLIASFPLSNSFLTALTLLGALTTPLVTIVLGYELQLRAGALSKPVRAVLARLVWWIPIALLFDYFVIRQWLQLDVAFQAAVLTMALLPPPFVIPLFMPGVSDNDVNFVVNALTLATVVTLIAYSFVPVLFPV
jgi:malate permease and related proteins